MLGFTRLPIARPVRHLAGLGWSFDVFDGLMFNQVGPDCVPTLLHLAIGSPKAKRATLPRTAILSCVLLLVWAAGGLLFGKIGDRIGRTRALLMTILLYAVSMAACAFAPNLWVMDTCGRSLAD